MVIVKQLKNDNDELSENFYVVSFGEKNSWIILYNNKKTDKIEIYCVCNNFTYIFRNTETQIKVAEMAFYEI